MESNVATHAAAQQTVPNFRWRGQLHRAAYGDVIVMTVIGMVGTLTA